MESERIIVFITVPGKEQGETIARGLLEKRLAACVNILENVSSFFWWDGKIDEANEALMILKTRRECFEALKEYVCSQHRYTVPEIIALSIEAGHKPYLQWIDASVASKKISRGG
jgi:periplasmic divalent cation tolerance protein